MAADHNKTPPTQLERLRIDKWLWASRFYKTRSLAADEIDKGRVTVNGAVVKPAKELKVGDAVEIKLGPVSRSVLVTQLSDKRGSATVAALLFKETEESLTKRLAAAEQRRLAPEPALSLEQGRPTKRDRRTLEKAQTWQTPDWNTAAEFSRRRLAPRHSPCHRCL